MDREKELAEDIKLQLEHLKDERHKREADWKNVQELVAPSVVSFDPAEKIPARPNRFTSRPTNYLKTLVSGITGYSISPNIVWQKLGLENAEQLDLYGVKDWLEAVERVLYAEFNRSNLYKQVPGMIASAAAYGHGVMLIDEDVGNSRLRFTSLSVPELYLDTNEYDEVETVYRRFTMTLGNAARFFGLENLAGNLRQDHEDRRKRNNEITVIHAVYRREDYDEEKPDAKHMPFASLYIDEGNDHLIRESGYREFPYAVFVWDKIGGAAYGESPAIYALDDIRLLNLAEESRIKIAQMSAEPAMNVPSTMKGSENVVPRGYNYYENPEEVMSVIQTGENYPISLEVVASIEDRIKDWFHVDFFLMLQSQSRQGRTQMTATEVVELQGEKAAVLSDLVVNLNEPLQKIIQRSFNLLLKQRKIPPIPDILRESGALLKVDFIGPLAQAQKKHHETGGIAQGIALIGSVANMAAAAPPALAALDVVDFDRLVKAGLEGAGTPQNIIREDDDIAAIREARARAEAQAQQQALALEEQKNILGNFNKLNEPLKQGTALEAMGQQMAGGGA
ncbi:MAG: head-tail connector protein [Treponema sp.]|jgi:hypothetical protein|nr:head-tail connector protein [Treponema sp.]